MTNFEDGVFIFIGFEPQNELVPAGTKLNADGYVITDEKCETNVPGLFAIGDLRERYARQIVLSAADGCLLRWRPLIGSKPKGHPRIKKKSLPNDGIPFPKNERAHQEL